MADVTQCLKCGGGRLRDGFVLDHIEEAKNQQTWIEGIPEPSTWSGMKTSNRAGYKVRAIRCAECGFLEFYADRKDENGGELISIF